MVLLVAVNCCNFVAAAVDLLLPLEELPYTRYIFLRTFFSARTDIDKTISDNGAKKHTQVISINPIDEAHLSSNLITNRFFHIGSHKIKQIPILFLSLISLANPGLKWDKARVQVKNVFSRKKDSKIESYLGCLMGH